MTQPEALKVLAEIESVCKRFDLHYSVEFQKRPELKFINIREISIKVTEQDRK